MHAKVISISEENKLVLEKPVDTNIVYYSEINEWFTGNAFRNFSLKLVLKESIFYKVDNTEYRVEADHFLLAAKQPYVKGYCDSGNIIRSICIDFCSSTIAEAYAVMSSEKQFDFDNLLNHHFTQPDFYNAIYPVKGTALGKKLDKLIPYIGNNQIANKILSRETVFDLIEQIILLEKGNQLALNGLHAVKSSTRRETLTRLQVAVKYMNDCILENPEIAGIATVCNMSEFHFFRSFRQAFGITPYQYMLKKRLEYSQELIIQKFPVQKIALMCGFPDTSTYSKAFKRHFGFSPTVYPGKAGNMKYGMSLAAGFFS